MRGRRTREALVLLAVVFVAGGGWTYAQNKPPRERDRSPEAAKPRERDRRHYRGSGDRPPRRSPRQFDLRPQFYRDGYGYRFGVPAFDEAREEELQRAYERGLEEGKWFEQYDLRTETGVFSYHAAMANGQAAFVVGDYGLAVRQLLLAATLDQGDPASRLAAAHALVAQGAYEPASRLVRRAFELQPRLVYLPLAIRGAYGNPDHFAQHLGALRQAAQEDKDNSGIWFLLGYFGYYSNNMADAADALGRAAELDPSDGLIQQLHELAAISAPRPLRGPSDRKPPPGDGAKRRGRR